VSQILIEGDCNNASVGLANLVQPVVVVYTWFGAYRLFDHLPVISTYERKGLLGTFLVILDSYREEITVSVPSLLPWLSRC
jgi:hypothetical protein